MICICSFFRFEDAFGFGIPTPWLMFKPCQSGESGLFARGAYEDAYEDIIVHQSCVMVSIEIYDEKGVIAVTHGTLLRRILIASLRTIMLLNFGRKTGDILLKLKRRSQSDQRG